MNFSTSECSLKANFRVLNERDNLVETFGCPPADNQKFYSKKYSIEIIAKIDN